MIAPDGTEAGVGVAYENAAKTIKTVATTVTTFLSEIMIWEISDVPWRGDARGEQYAFSNVS